MKSTDIYSWLDHPEGLDKITLEKLADILAEYPYFQTVRLLYQKNLQILRHQHFSSELPKTAIFCVDRKKLYYLINRQYYSQFFSEDKLGSQVQEDRTKTLLDSFLKTSGGESESIPPTFGDSGIEMVSYDYLSYLKLFEPKNMLSRSDENVLNHHDIIDQFIEKADSNEFFTLRDDVAEEKEQVDCMAENEIDEDEFLTETLAKIYIKQKKYKQALTIIKRLSLNFPKKNAYFADQIHFLEYLIINEKNKKQS